MREISDDLKAAQGSVIESVTVATASVPGVGEVPLELHEAQGVRLNWTANRGTRTTAGMRVKAEPGLYELLDRPGTTFSIEAGADFGAGRVETHELFFGYGQTASTGLALGAIDLQLYDPWQWWDTVPFTAPLTYTSLTRAQAIRNVIDGAAGSGVEYLPSADGGTVTQNAVSVTGNRGSAIQGLAEQGGLDVFWDGTKGSGGKGRVVIRREPVLQTAAATNTFTTGESGRIMRDSGTRTRNMGRVYNAVAVSPASSAQTWTTQTVKLSDTSDWAHESKIGLRPFSYTSATDASSAEAKVTAANLLQRLRRRLDEVTVSLPGDISVEVGDTITLVTQKYATDDGFRSNFLVTGIDFDTRTWEMSITGTQAGLYGTE